MDDDVEAIKRLKARYFRLIDTKAWDELVGVFTPDVVTDTTATGGPVVEGAEEWVAFLRKALGDGIVTVHHGHTPEIELTSATTATGIWAMEDWLWWPEGGPFKQLHGFGHYHETYERSDAGWQIKTLTLTRLHSTTEPELGG
jgi:SnoaL-like protein